jgi:polysaccharide biosynthesis protein PslJ
VSTGGATARGSLVLPTALAAAGSLGATAAVLGHARIGAVPLIVLAVWFAGNLVGPGLLAWQTQVAALVAVVMFIPIRRYTLPASLPFELEPYRLLVALIAAMWVTSLLIDSRVRLRRTGFEGPLAAVMLALFCSIVPNVGRISELGLTTYVVKTLTFFATFLVVYYIVTSLIRKWQDIDATLSLLVGCGVVVAVFALIEARTGANAFNHLRSVIPILQQHSDGYLVPRGARLRSLASAQHPIALGAMLAMLLPFIPYLATRGNRWPWIAGGSLLALATVATVSRTAILMLVVEGLVFLWLRPRETKRLWPLLIPVLLAAHLAVPGTVGTLKDAFLPEGGIVAEQQSGANTRGSGRLADLGPTLDQWAEAPVLGHGVGTRVVEDGPDQNAGILDDQWLGLLLDAGLAGVIAMIWLMRRALRRLAAGARTDPSPRGLLLTAATASVAAYAVGMLTFDAFSFVQVTFVFFILLGLATSALLASDGPDREPAPAPA